MTETPSLEAALRRLSTALAHLEEAADSRPPGGGEQAGAELARALDVSRERADRLEAANRDVARRVDEAVTSIQSVLNDEVGSPDQRTRGDAGGEG